MTKFKHHDVTTPQLERKIINGHRFYKTPNGIWVPSSSTLSKVDDTTALDNWILRMGPEAAKREAKRAADRGDGMHEMCELYLRGVEFDQDQYSITSRQLFNKCRLILNKSVDDVIMQEQMLYSEKYYIAGQVDLIASFNGILSIIDFKSSTNVKTDDHVQHYLVQAATYGLMFNEMFNANIDQVVIIVSSEKGLVPSVIKRTISGDLYDSTIDKINKYAHKYGDIIVKANS